MSQPVKDEFDVYSPGWGPGPTWNKTAAVTAGASTEAAAGALRKKEEERWAPRELS